MAQKSKFDQFADDMRASQDAQQAELEMQTIIQVQMAHHQQMTNFSLWKDSSDGRRYLAWLLQVEKIFQQSRKIQDEFSKAYSRDLQEVNAEISQFCQVLGGSKKPLVIRFNFIIWLVIINLPLIFLSIERNFLLPTSSISDDGYIFALMKAFALGVVVEILLIILYPILRRKLIMQQARKAWEAAFPASIGFQEKVNQCRWLIRLYMNLETDKINSDYDFIKLVYKGRFKASFKNRSWYRTNEVNGMSLIDYYNRFIDEAPESLPVNLPALKMPTPASSSDFPSGTHAANFLKIKYNS